MTEEREHRLTEIADELRRLSDIASVLRDERNLILGGMHRRKQATSRERKQIAIALRAQGKTYAAIGRELGVTGNRVPAMIAEEMQSAAREKAFGLDPMKGLSVRTENTLRNYFNGRPLTADDIIDAANRIADVRRIGNFGKRSERELLHVASSLLALREHKQ